MWRDDIIAFARRDWASLAAAKEAYWPQQKKRMTAADALRISDALRHEVLRLRPDWPSDEERQEDLAVHSRVSEILGRVGPRRRY